MATPDPIQAAIDAVLNSDKTHEEKMAWLDSLAPMICQLYEQGLTTVKPVHLMTSDDLVC